MRLGCTPHIVRRAPPPQVVRFPLRFLKRYVVVASLIDIAAHEADNNKK